MCSHPLAVPPADLNGSCSSKNLVSRVPRPYSADASSSQKSRSFEVPRSTRSHMGPEPYGDCSAVPGPPGWNPIV